MHALRDTVKIHLLNLVERALARGARSVVEGYASIHVMEAVLIAGLSIRASLETLDLEGRREVICGIGGTFVVVD